MAEISPTPPPATRRRWPPAADIAAGLILLVLSNGRWIVPAAAWLAPVFLLRASRRLRSPWAWAGLFVLFAAATRVMFYGIIPSLLGALTYGLTLYYALLTFLPYLIDRFLVRRAGGTTRFAATLIYPAAVVVLEYANALAFGDWGSIAFSQYGNLPLMQVLSVTGLWGLSFLVAWFGALVNWGIDNGRAWPKIARGASLAAAVYAAVLLFGGARLAFLDPRSPASPTIRVASFTFTEKDLKAMAGFPSSSTAAAAPKEKAELERLYHKMLFDKVASCAKSGASVVFWAEGMLDVREEMVPEFVRQGSQAASEPGIFLLMPIYVQTRGWPKSPGMNKAILITPEGKVVWDYLKSHPVPGSSDVAGNRRIPFLTTSFGRMGAAICYDLDFPAMIRQAGRNRVDVMLDPAWDWRAIDPLHARMAAFRAVENGFALVRQTGEGLSLAVDALGRPIAAQDYFATADRVMIVDVPSKGCRTLYSRIGDVFAWACLAVLLLALFGVGPRYIFDNKINN